MDAISSWDFMMEMTLWIQALALTVFVIATRLLFLAAARTASIDSSDRHVYLWLLNGLKDNYDIRSRNMLRVIGARKASFTLLPYVFIARLPSKRQIPALYVLNLLSELLLAGVTYFAVQKSGLPADPFGVTLVVLSCPLLLPPNARMTSLGARAFGNSLFLIYGLGMLTFADAPTWTAGALTAAMVAVTLNTSIFASQAVVFSTLLYALVSWNALPLLPLASGASLAFLLPTGTHLQWLGRLHHYKWYLGHDKAGPRASLLPLLGFLVRFRGLKALREGLSGSPFSIVALNFPLLFIWAQQAMASTHLPPVMALGVSVCVIFLLTSFRPLRIFGESERYIDLAVPFFAFALADSHPYLFQGQWLVAIMCWNVAIICLNHTVLHWNSFIEGMRLTPPSKDMAELVEFLRHSPQQRFLTAPVKNAYILGRLAPEKSFFYFNFEPDAGFSRFRDTCTENLYQVKDELDVVLATGAEAIVCSKKSLPDLAKVTSSAKEVFHNASYSVFSLHTVNAQSKEAMHEPS